MIETPSSPSLMPPIIDTFTHEVLGNDEVKLEWKLLGGAPKTLTLHYQKEGATSKKDVPILLLTKTSHTFSDLEPGDYIFTLFAVNDAAPRRASVRPPKKGAR